MSGLLQRLAGQALGQPPPLRPRANARFAEPAVTPQADDATPPLLVPLRPQPNAHSALDASPGAQREPFVAERSPRRDAPDVVVSHGLSHRPREPALGSSSASPSAEPPLLLPLERAEPGKLDDRRRAATSSTDPASPRPALSALPDRRDLATQREVESNEVHIHIGRIEVTAVHESPRKRESVARPSPSRRLEDYLRPRGTR